MYKPKLNKSQDFILQYQSMCRYVLYLNTKTVYCTSDVQGSSLVLKLVSNGKILKQKSVVLVFYSFSYLIVGTRQGIHDATCCGKWSAL
jgi:hypothetical protein